jgi:hypothetical protein
MKKPVQMKKNLEELKRSEGKLSRCVSRGGSISNNSSLLDQVAPTKGFRKGRNITQLKHIQDS